MDYDLIIIGAGWAGFNAALKAQHLGLKTALIERGQIGGTCLNRGCIPTKALLQSIKIYSLSKKASLFGIENSSPLINFTGIQQRKNQVVGQLASGMQSLLKGLDYIQAEAKLISGDTVSLGNRQISAKYILIATGSKPMELPFLKFDGKKVISSDQALELETVPKSLLIVGAGAIGCEFATIFSALGSQVEIIEKMPQVLPGEDAELARRLQNAFKKSGVKVNLSADAAKIDILPYERVLVSVGRIPLTFGLGLKEVGVICTDRGAIQVDSQCRTSIGSIFAAGDCTAKYMLAHYASYQGVVAVENMLALEKNQVKPDNQVVPACVFCDPEIASVGFNEEAAKNAGIDFLVHRFDFRALGMAHILDKAEGLIKIISEKETSYVIGACIIGAGAAEIINLFSVAIRSKLKISQLRDAIFAHPTISEGIAESLNS